MLYKDKLSPLLLALTVPISLNTYADAVMGFDIGHQGRGFKKGYGQEVFAKNSKYSTVYIEKMFHEYFGLEAGMTVTKKRKRQAELGVGDAFPGQSTILTNGANATVSNIKSRKYYLGLVKVYPCTSKIKIFGLIGFSRAWMHAQYNPTKSDNDILNLDSQNASINTFKIKGYNFILKIGAKYNITDNFGIRATIAWENTSKYSPTASYSVLLNSRIKYKNTNQIGMGFYFGI